MMMAISAKTKNVPYPARLKKIFFNCYVRLECTTTFYVNTKYFVEIFYVVQNQGNTSFSLNDTRNCSHFRKIKPLMVLDS